MGAKLGAVTASVAGVVVALVASSSLESDADAATRTRQLNVVVNVDTSCGMITSQNMAFGNYSGAQIDAQASVILGCTTQVNAFMMVSLGLQPGPGGTRQMSRGAARLRYQIYSDTARTQVWDPLSGIPLSGWFIVWPMPIYGRVFAGQAPGAVGAYTDTVVVSMLY